ncbi:MAG: glycosyltransferase family 39 protein [Coleofasciculaceae cyanobacterium]
MVKLLGVFNNKFGKQIHTFFDSPKLPVAILFFSLLVRLVQYLSNRSLWADEAVLALNIVNRSYLELLQPLDYNQAAPIGFLMVEKLAVQLFGNHEYSLRLFPFVSSLVSLLLFYKLARQCLRPKAILIALSLFGSLNYLVYYSSEVKQYSSDVLVALMLCLFSIQLTVKKQTLTKVVLLGVVGIIAIWFSHPAIFVVVGMTTSSLFRLIKSKREVKHTLVVAATYLSWLLSFLAFYFLSLKKLNNNQDLMESWRSAFPSNPFDINWLLEKLLKLFINPLGFNELLAGVAIIAFICGCVSMFTRKREFFALLLSPLFFTVLAAYLHKYPFRNRLLLFLSPFLILLIAEGAMYIWQKAYCKRFSLLGAVFLLLLLTPPLANASYLLVKPYVREEISPVISYVKNHQQPEDILYIFQRGEYQFKYYASQYGYQPQDYIIGVDDLEDGKTVSPAEWQRYRNDLDGLRGNNRVWIIFSHTAKVPEEEQRIISYLNQIGKPVDFFEKPGSFVYLYNLSLN